MINLYYEGASGRAKIKRILDTYRANPPKAIGDVAVTKFQRFRPRDVHGRRRRDDPKQDLYFVKLVERLQLRRARQRHRTEDESSTSRRRRRWSQRSNSLRSRPRPRKPWPRSATPLRRTPLRARRAEWRPSSNDWWPRLTKLRNVAAAASKHPITTNGVLVSHFVTALLFLFAQGSEQIATRPALSGLSSIRGYAAVAFFAEYRFVFATQSMIAASLCSCCQTSRRNSTGWMHQSKTRGHHRARTSTTAAILREAWPWSWE